MICVSDQKSAQNTFTFYYLASEISLSIALSMINEGWAPGGGDDDQGIQGTELDGVTCYTGGGFGAKEVRLNFGEIGRGVVN